MEHITCEKAKELFDSKADGLISEHERDLLDRHLKECESCRKEYKELEALHQYMCSLAVSVPSQLHENVMASIKKEPRHRTLHLKWMRPLAAVSAAALLCVALLHAPFIKELFHAKSAMDMAEAAGPMEEDQNNSLGFDNILDGKADRDDPTEDISENYDKELPEVQEGEMTLGVLARYTVADTDLLLMILNERQAMLCRDSGGETVEMIRDFTYTKADGSIILEDNGKTQTLLVSGNSLIPKQDGALLDQFTK